MVGRRHSSNRMVRLRRRRRRFVRGATAMKFVAVLLEVVLAFVVGSYQPDARPAAQPSLSDGESRMVMAVNKYRATFRLPPLAIDPILMRVARQRVGVYDHHAFGKWSWE